MNHTNAEMFSYMGFLSDFVRVVVFVMHLRYCVTHLVSSLQAVTHVVDLFQLDS